MKRRSLEARSSSQTGHSSRQDDASVVQNNFRTAQCTLELCLVRGLPTLWTHLRQKIHILTLPYRQALRLIMGKGQSR